jgi:phosphoenolpyruvate-protein phosphotransferase
VITIAGIALVPGVAAGTARTLQTRRSVAALGAEAGPPRERLERARRDAQRELTASLPAVPEGPAREILRAHIALLGDPVLAGEIDLWIERGLGAEDALGRATSSLTERFEKLDNPMLRARAADLRDVCECVARHLAGGAVLDAAPEAGIVCAAELSPAQVLQMFEQRPLACVLESNAFTSHAAILLRALGVPAIMGVPRITEVARDGALLLVDGTRGRVVIDPDPDLLGTLDGPAVIMAEPDAQPARTVDGVVVKVTATVVDSADALRAIAAGADGIGLFRTEWLFLSGDALPSEQRQYEAYRGIAEMAGERPVTMRAIDLGGDKRPPALPLAPEPNPALGLRGVRLAFVHPDVMKTQLRALLRAFHGRPLRLLLPMVTDASDVARMRELLDDAGAGSTDVQMGVMIETPAAAMMADELAASVDFLSLGTNDLTQYVLAADRENPSTAALYRELHPAVLRILRLVMTAAVRHGRPVSACGEAAADPLAARLLLGMGVTELSVPAAAVAATKRLIRRTSRESARALGNELASLPTASAVATRLEEIRKAEALECTRGS